MSETEKLNLTGKELSIIFFVLMTSLCTYFSIDMYLPSLPAIEISLGVSQAIAQYTVSVYLLGMGISVLFFGPMSDKTGRKPLILAGLILNTIGCVFCFKANSAQALLAGRLIQGLGAGASMGAIRAMVSDSFTSKRLAMITAYFGTIMAVSPVLAPLAGGYLETYFNWRANFIVLGTLFGLVFIWGCFISETNQNRHLHSYNILHHLKNYATLFKAPTFLLYSFCGSLAIAVSMAYATSGPFVFQKVLGLTPLQFGWIGIFIGLGNILGKLLTPMIVKRCDMEKTFAAGLVAILISGLIIGVPLLVGIINLEIAIIAIMLSMFGQGLSLITALALGISSYRHIGGAAMALWTSMQMGLSFLVSYLLSCKLLEAHQAAGLAMAYIGIGLITIIANSVYQKFYKPQGDNG